MSGIGRTAEQEIERRLESLTLQEKVAVVTGDSTWTTRAVPSIGLRPVVFADGPAGVQGPDPEALSTSLPAPTALAATWDLVMARRAGRVFAREARAKGVDVVLAPVLNLQRTPVGGRHFENLSEDPILTAQLGAAMIASIQDSGVGACAKHFVANDSETARTTYVARVDPATLHEAYLLPFNRAVRQAGAWVVMAAYNGVDDGTGAAPMTEHAGLLRDLLKGEWRFDGLVVSDWEATRSIVASAAAGLDLVMPGPGGPWEDALERAVHSGDVPEGVLDDKVRRLLRLAARVGKLDGVLPAPLVTGPPTGQLGSERDAGREPEDTDAARFSRALAAKAMVVLRRDGSVPLPLCEPGRAPASIALLGANAAQPYVQGGGSAHVNAPHEVSPLEGLRSALAGTTDVRWARGGRTLTRPPQLDIALTDNGRGAPGMLVEVLAGDRAVLTSWTRETADLTWICDLPPEADVLRVSTTVRLSEPGTHVLELGSIGRHEVWVDGTSVARSTEDRGVEAILDSSVNAPPGRAVQVLVDHPRAVRVVAELTVVDAAGYGRLVSAVLRHRSPEEGADAEIAEAADLAALCDVAVVVVGTNPEVESEGWDRADLRLPGNQDRLVRAVLAANPRTLVVVNAGAPVELPWLDDVPTVLWAWLPGQEFGHALADVLLGRVEPAGRLPWTLPASLAHVPVPHATPEHGVVAYHEGARVGYRSWETPAPAAPFGHGLGWSDWEYIALEVSQRCEELAVSVTVRNAGAREASEVVQVYVDGPQTRGARLAGFALARDVASGCVVTVTVQLDAAAWEHWDDRLGRMLLVPGAYEVQVARSVQDVRLRHWRTICDVPAPSGPVTLHRGRSEASCDRSDAMDEPREVPSQAARRPRSRPDPGARV